MKLLNVVRFSSMAATLAGGAWAQTQIDLRTQAKSVNFSAASFTLPSQTGPVLPATCQVGATFILTTSLAGQNWYICTTANQWTLQGNTLPAQAGNSGAVLSTNGTSLSWSALGGDISGVPPSISVNKLLGRKLNTVAPTAGQLLGWDGTQWTPQTLSLTIPVTSVFGRTGAIAAQSGDYAAAQVTNAVDFTQPTTYLAGARQSFYSSANSAGIQVAPGPLPNSPFSGDLAVDSGDSNRIKVYNGSTWVSLNPVLPPGNYTSFFTAATAVSIPGGTHNLGTANLIVQCYDNSSPNNLVEPSQITIEPATFNVTVTFATSETGRCVLNGYNGGSGSSSSASGGAGMASQLGDLNVVWSSPSTLTIGGNCSPATPCNVRFGTQIYALTTPALATAGSSSTGTAYVYIDATGALTVGSSMTVNCVSGCVAATGISGFPINTIPIYTWTATGGTWDSNGGSDRRGWLSTSPVLGGVGIAAIATAWQTTISVDSAVVPTYLMASATLDFPSIPAGACATDLTFSLPGANAGDAVAAGWPAGLEAGLSGNMRISAAGVVSVRLCASTAAAVNPAAAIFTATVIRGF